MEPSDSADEFADKLTIFGTNVRKELSFRKKSISWLAKKSGVSQCMLSYYLCGKSEPTLSKALRIAKALRLPLSHLTGDAQFVRDLTMLQGQVCTRTNLTQKIEVQPLHENAQQASCLLTEAKPEPLRQCSNAALLAELERRLNTK